MGRERKLSSWKHGWKRRIATRILTVLLAGEIAPVLPALRAFAAPLESTVEYEDDHEDPWERMEERGQEAAVTFPCQLEAYLSTGSDVDVYSFRLDKTVNVEIRLESDDACGLELYSRDILIGESHRQYSQSISMPEMTPGVYSVHIYAQEGTVYSGYRLKLFEQTDKTSMPDYSEAHIAGTVFDRLSPLRWLTLDGSEKNRGGNLKESIYYLAHWQGPVREAVMPYYDKGDYMETPSDYINYVNAAPESHIQEVLMLPTSEVADHEEHWKNAIMTYGALNSGFIMNYYACWGNLQHLYYYKASEEKDDGGHATTLIGWDDTIPKERFGHMGIDAENRGRWYEPSRDGGWICKDSYGTAGENAAVGGYFYISYENAELGSAGCHMAAYTGSEKSDNYNHLYSNSSAGMEALSVPGYTGAGETFQTAEKEELLRAVGFITPTADLNYRIYLRVDGSDELQLLKSGYEKYAGFHTERLDKGIALPADTAFEVIVDGKSRDGNIMNFYASFNCETWMEGVEYCPDKSTYYQIDEDGTILGYDYFDDDGVYPCIYAYTYTPSQAGLSEITILDLRDDGSETEVGEYETIAAPRSNSMIIKRKNAAKTEQASASDTDPEEDEEESGNLDVELIFASPSNVATMSDLATASNQEPATQNEEAPKQRRFADGYRVDTDGNNHEAGGLDLVFPARYDLREHGEITPPKHQGNSNICWAFASVASIESSYLKAGNSRVNYPRGLAISSDQIIEDGVIHLSITRGEELPVNFTGMLYSDSEYFKPATDQIYWEVSGDMDSIRTGAYLSENQEQVPLLTALSAGTVTVTATSLADKSLRASCKVEVTEDIPAKVTLTPSSKTLYVGASFRLACEVETEDGSKLTVQYSSDAPQTAEVSADGKVFALNPGTAVITAKAGSGSASCVVTVLKRSAGEDDNGSGSADGPGKNSLSYPDTVRGSWEQADSGWQFRKEDGTFAVSTWERINGQWYYFKPDTYLAGGWRLVDGQWYYFNQDAATYGQMQTGWFFDPAYQSWFYLQENGVMAVSWMRVGDKWYYFETRPEETAGRMYADTTTPDGFPVGSDGAGVS